ncbi:hypothetical protein A5699_16315 [Mycobacterium sp. E802]|nr:hypothetical protein A5699_16315 [Mycobacterium sp. E802]
MVVNLGGRWTHEDPRPVADIDRQGCNTCNQRIASKVGFGAAVRSLADATDNFGAELAARSLVSAHDEWPLHRRKRRLTCCARQHQ